MAQPGQGQQPTQQHLPSRVPGPPGTPPPSSSCLPPAHPLQRAGGLIPTTTPPHPRPPRAPGPHTPDLHPRLSPGHTVPCLTSCLLSHAPPLPTTATRAWGPGLWAPGPLSLRSLPPEDPSPHHLWQPYLSLRAYDRTSSSWKVRQPSPPQTPLRGVAGQASTQQL